MSDEITWTVTEPDGRVTVQSNRKKIPFVQEFEVTDKTPKNQLFTIEMWNKMRQRLLELGEMEPK